MSKFYLCGKVLKVDAKEDEAVTDILNMYESYKIWMNLLELLFLKTYMSNNTY